MKSFVYALRSTTYVKIGFSRTPDDRLRKLQVASPHPVSMVVAIEVADEDARKIEAAVHRMLRSVRLTKRGEWFATTPDVAERAIRTAIRLHENPDLKAEIEQLEESGPPVYSDGRQMPHFSKEVRAYRARIAELKGNLTW